MKTALLVLTAIITTAAVELPPLPPETSMPLSPRPSPSFYTAAMPSQNTNQALGPAGQPYSTVKHIAPIFGSGSNCLETINSNYVVIIRYTWDTNVYSPPIVIIDNTNSITGPPVMFFRPNKPIP